MMLTLCIIGVSPLTGKTKDIGRHCGNAPSSIGHHPMMYASQNGHVETVLEMIPYVKVDDLEQALGWAAKSGHFGLVSALLEAPGVSPDAVARHSGFETVLMLATSSLEPKCVRILLEKGANVHNTSEGFDDDIHHMHLNGNSRRLERTPLHAIATTRIDPKQNVAAREIMDMLFAAGADIEARDRAGNTPLLLTVGNASGCTKVVLDWLLSVGADPCAVDFNGETLLHRACKSLSGIEVAARLLDYKANPEQARASDGATPVHW